VLLSYKVFYGDSCYKKGLPTFPFSTGSVLRQIAFALYLSLHAVSKFYFIWIPIFPIVVFRGHISASLCSWSQCEGGTRKTLRQAYGGSRSIYRWDKFISFVLRLLSYLRSFGPPDTF
jgi:hypothetical protein